MRSALKEAAFCLSLCTCDLFFATSPSLTNRRMGEATGSAHIQALEWCLGGSRLSVRAGLISFLDHYKVGCYLGFLSINNLYYSYQVPWCHPPGQWPLGGWRALAALQ